MNREIKYRAWDIDNERMHYSGSMEFIAYDFAIGCCVGITLNEGWKNPYHYSAKLMQYTGLNNKQGKEIYDGDIIKITCEWGYSLHSIDFCEYSDDEQYTTNSHIGWRAKTLKTFYINTNAIADDRTLSDVDSYCEVIGNIYENPELI